MNFDDGQDASGSRPSNEPLLAPSSDEGLRAVPVLKRRSFVQTMLFGAASLVGGPSALSQTSRPSEDSPQGTTDPHKPAAAGLNPTGARLSVHFEGASHPLDPLTAGEIERVSSLLAAQGIVGEQARFWTISLLEPPKESVLRPPGAGQPNRRALAILFQKDTGVTSEYVVDLTKGTAALSRRLTGIGPGPLNEEYERVPEIVLASPRFVEAMAKRGITDLDKVYVDVWASGPIRLPGDPREGRLFRAIPYLNEATTTLYSRPIEGVIVTVDLLGNGGEGAVVEVMDSGARPLPPEGKDARSRNIPYTAPPEETLPGTSDNARDLSFEGHRVTWGPWQFRWSFLDREGLVLHQVTIRDGEERRSVLYRASLAEIIAPYGDPEHTWAWKNAFDQGEYGLGKSSSLQLRRGLETPPHAVLADAVFSDDSGKPNAFPDRVAFYERDGGILWTHTDWTTGEAVTRRGQELVVMFICTIGNYDYIFSWIFAEDGKLTYQVEPTGVLLVKGVQDSGCAVCKVKPGPSGEIEASGEETHGTLVAPHLAAVYHQHLLNVRLDFDIDGVSNGVREYETEPLPPGPGNPYGNAFRVQETALLTEKAARRDAKPQASRMWKVVNTEKPNALGHFPGYMIHSMETAPMLAQPESAGRRKAGFTDHAFWATRCRPEERFAAGDYIDSDRAEALREWSADDQKIEGEDLVVWHTFGMTHIPRAEEWPIMPAARFGFSLIPHHFFTSNPTIPEG